MAERKFNTAGPVKSADEYCIDPLSRVDWPDVRGLIDDKKYFVLHAPRQTGKTTTLYEIMRTLNAEGRHACVYANIEAAQTSGDDDTKGMAIVAGEIAAGIDSHTPGLAMEDWLYGTGDRVPAQRQVSGLLAHWARIAGKPTVLLLDEVDALVGNTLITLLRQIRSRYADRPAAFPQSVVLCGVRDVRDYRMTSPGGEVITGGSAFNIKTKSLRLGDFSEAEVRGLFGQHT
ncbi:MAG: ATP-binding protein, partial [Propionibacteriaceae bacterium]|nr:ATP-binding protein [Propionibacteriaceae bacterium]